MTQFKQPMLAAPLLPPRVEHTDDNIFAAMQKLKYPVMATLKRDGIRGLRLNDSLLSRTLKLIPNKQLREASLIMPCGFDMELWNKELRYDDIESIVMSREHPDTDSIQFHVLDWFYSTDGFTYLQRCNLIAGEMHNLGPRVKFSPPQMCHNAEQLFAFEKLVIEEVGEGICFRTPNSPYKQGRSTLKEQYLVKLSRFSYEEATIIGFIEQQENNNLDNRHATGVMNRGSSKEYMLGKNTLGAFEVRTEDGLEFSIGTGVGLTDKLRKEIWENRSEYLGRTVKYKCKAHGRKLKPRSPVWAGFRNMEIDG